MHSTFWGEHEHLWNRSLDKLPYTIEAIERQTKIKFWSLWEVIQKWKLLNSEVY